MKRLISALVHSEDMLWSKEELCEEFGVDSLTYDICKLTAYQIDQMIINGELTHDDVYKWAKSNG